jgi:hypothetical protein
MPDTYLNVREPWVDYDTIKICGDLYGSEADSGFFTTFQAFAQRDEHFFFKQRSEGNVHRAYTNQMTEDRTDSVFHIMEIGVLFLAPPTPLDRVSTTFNEAMQAFWTTELPRHTSVSLEIGQDTKLELQSMMASPGYGPVGSGAAFGVDDPFDSGNLYGTPEFMWSVCQGVPEGKNRYWLCSGEDTDPQPIGVPKGEIRTVRLKISEFARRRLQGANPGPGAMMLGQQDEAPAITLIKTAYRIQVSLWGYREVQQRGQLRAV